ncbi:MAG TPA: hypothetical protein VFC52_01965 [Solirubrobacterales bacterium]|nr:hypothetical protein [Solirubrobacterales bacterium]
MCSRRPRARNLSALAALAALLAGLWATTGAARAVTLVPPKQRVFLGVSDKGTAEDFYEFADLVGKRPPLLETFHPWGNSLNNAYRRWQETATRPILHISTFDDQTLRELITPRQIALGAGDDYLLQLNDFLAKRALRIYIRPLGEPNRCLNPYSAVNCDGSKKGGDHATLWYKQAFRRIVTIVRGGGDLATIDSILAGIGLPPVKRSKGPAPKFLPPALTSFIWSPLPAGSPRAPGNWPGNYWPGGRWVDWVGTDFYSQYPHWRDLNRFFYQRRWRRKPFALTELAVAGEDDPRFIKRLVAWTVRRSRVRMFVYYRGFGTADNPYQLGFYPRTTNTLRRKIRRNSFPPYAWAHAGTLAPLPTRAEERAKEKAEKKAEREAAQQ